MKEQIRDKQKDWKGNKKSTFSTIGSNAHSDNEREKNDYYATDPKVIEKLFEVENFSDIIWEPACGEGHLSKEIEKYAKSVLSTDLIDRGYGTSGIDFLKETGTWNGDIITNPPYRFASEFVENSMNLIDKSEVQGLKVAMFLKILFLETQKRKKLFEKYPPKIIYVFSKRVICALNGEFEKFRDKYGKNHGGAVAYAWFIWEKGYKGDTIIKWI